MHSHIGSIGIYTTFKIKIQRVASQNSSLAGEGEENKIKALFIPRIQPSPFGEGFKTCVDTYAAREGFSVGSIVLRCI